MAYIFTAAASCAVLGGSNTYSVWYTGVHDISRYIPSETRPFSVGVRSCIVEGVPNKVGCCGTFLYPESGKKPNRVLRKFSILYTESTNQIDSFCRSNNRLDTETSDLATSRICRNEFACLCQYATSVVDKHLNKGKVLEYINQLQLGRTLCPRDFYNDDNDYKGVIMSEIHAALDRVNLIMQWTYYNTLHRWAIKVTSNGNNDLNASEKALELAFKDAWMENLRDVEFLLEEERLRLKMFHGVHYGKLLSDHDRIMEFVRINVHEKIISDITTLLLGEQLEETVESIIEANERTEISMEATNGSVRTVQALTGISLLFYIVSGAMLLYQYLL